MITQKLITKIKGFLKDKPNAKDWFVTLSNYDVTKILDYVDLLEKKIVDLEDDLMFHPRFEDDL